MFPDERRRPVLAPLVPVDAPGLLAAVLLEGRDERVRGVVVDDVQPIVVQDGRGSGPHLECRVVSLQLARPYHFAAHVEGGKLADGAEIDVDPAPVGHRRLRRETVLQVALARRCRSVQLSLPPDRAGVEVERVEHPAVLVLRRFRSVLHPRVVEPLDRLRLVSRADGGSDEDQVARHDRRTPGKPRDVGLPDDVFRLGPVLRQLRIVRHDASRRPPELKPVLLRGGGRRNQQQASQQRRDQGGCGTAHRSPSLVRSGCETFVVPRLHASRSVCQERVIRGIIGGTTARFTRRFGCETDLPY